MRQKTLCPGTESVALLLVPTRRRWSWPALRVLAAANPETPVESTTGTCTFTGIPRTWGHLTARLWVLRPSSEGRKRFPSKRKSGLGTQSVTKVVTSHQYEKAAGKAVLSLHPPIPASVTVKRQVSIRSGKTWHRALLPMPPGIPVAEEVVKREHECRRRSRS